MVKTLRAAALLLLASCVVEPVPTGFDGRDVRGNYALTYDNKLKVQLNLAGATRAATANGYGEVVDFGTYQGMPLKLDLAQWCAREDVQCPDEVFWPKVAIDQPDLKANGVKLQKLVVVNDTVHTLDAGVRAAVVAGLVNNDDFDRFLIGLGAGGGSNPNCVLLGVSLAGGRFSRKGESLEDVTEFRNSANMPCDPDAGTTDAGTTDAGTTDAGTTDAGTTDAGKPETCAAVTFKRLKIPKNAPADGIVDGRLGVAWAGGCAFGPIVAGATLTLETGFTGKKTGDYDPPPFTPVEVTLPDAGFDGGSVDGG